MIDWLKKSSPKGWLSARILTLLAHYFINQTDERVAKAVAEDWIGILCVLPPWAISNACRKYLSGDDRRRKPIPGDILELAQKELWFVNSVVKALTEREKIAAIEPTREINPKVRARIAARFKELSALMQAKSDALKPPGKIYTASHPPRVDEYSQKLIGKQSANHSAITFSNALMQTSVMKKAEREIL